MTADATRQQHSVACTSTLAAATAGPLPDRPG
jgi:hypothetical protein